MKAVIQRVKHAHVEVSGESVGAIGPGLLILLGVEQSDTEEDARYLADRCAGLRIFEDGEGKLNLSAAQAGGALLVVSNFTVCADCRHGRRPNFMAAAGASQASALYRLFVDCCREAGLHVETGVFGADMQVHLINDGPVTVLVESDRAREEARTAGAQPAAGKEGGRPENNENQDDRGRSH